MERDRVHQRSPSNSFRISINGTASPSRDLAHSKRPRKRAHARTLQESAWDMAEDGTRWLGGRVGRAGPRRWTVLIGLAAVFVLYRSFVGEEEGENGGVWRLFGMGASNVVEADIPTVDRQALEKLRLLEIHFGADEDMTDDQPRTRPTVGHPAAALEDSDAPPLVAEIPEILKPNPSAPVPLSKVPADILDAEVCPNRDGEPCAFLIPAWLGAFDVIPLHIACADSSFSQASKKRRPRSTSINSDSSP
jgi:hypothetical protein